MIQTDMDYLGNHILVEFYGCHREIISDHQLIESELVRAAELSNAKIIGSNAHLFEPQGVSAVVIIAESHLTIHTWPEHGYAAVDLFYCSDTVNPRAAFDYLKNALCAQRTSSIEMKRGLLNDM